MNEPLSSEAINNVADLLVKIREMESAIDQAIYAIQNIHVPSRRLGHDRLMLAYRELERVRNL